MRQEGRSPVGMTMIGVVGLFIAGFLMLVLFGAGSYRAAVAGQAENRDKRAVLSYLETCVKGGDTAGGVTIREGQTGPVLLIREGSSDYALHIYAANGKLLEEYKAIDAAEVPENADVIADTQTFVPVIDGGLLTVTTDEGRAVIFLRAGKETP